MRTGWFIVAVLCCWGASVAAEEMILTTYYPAPNGQYLDMNVSGALTGATATMTGAITGLNLIASGANPSISLLRNGVLLFAVDSAGNITGAAAAFTGGVSVGADLSVAGAVGATGNISSLGVLWSRGGISTEGSIGAVGSISASGNITSSGILWSQGGISTVGSIGASGTVSAVSNMSANDYYIASKNRWASQGASINYGSCYYSGGGFTSHTCAWGYVMVGVADWWEYNACGNIHFPIIYCCQLQ